MLSVDQSKNRAWVILAVDKRETSGMIDELNSRKQEICPYKMTVDAMLLLYGGRAARHFKPVLLICPMVAIQLQVDVK
jgi:hypothetical protein